MDAPTTGRNGARALTATAAGIVLTLAAAALPRAGEAQRPDTLAFGVGERLSYVARVARVGKVGKATMWVDGPVDVRGRSTWVLHFNFKARVGPVKAEDRTESWLDPVRMAALRFRKHERHPLSKHDEQVELFPGERRWQAADGTAGASATDAPLDELSFMYFLRTLALPADTTYRFDRHYDATRNPTTVTVVKRESLTTGAGVFRTVLLEMRVRDPRRYHGDGVIRISLTDDARRLPVRIESAMPVIGSAVLTLDSYTPRVQPTVASRP